MLALYYAMLIKLLYFELQSHVSKHAMFVNRLRGVLWTLAHMPVYVCAAGAGGILHKASNGTKWLVRDRHVFLGFTVVLMLSLSLVQLFHGKLHNDKNLRSAASVFVAPGDRGSPRGRRWWTKKKIRVAVRAFVCALLVVGVFITDPNNVYTLGYADALLTIDFVYEFYAKRQIAEEHELEEVLHAVDEPEGLDDDEASDEFEENGDEALVVAKEE